jgi:putative ABC transport system permease protein
MAMRFRDHIELSFANLWKRKLRTSLTVFGVTIGIGALVSMVSFGKGIQKNVTESFRSLDLFNSLTVLPGNLLERRRGDPDERRELKPPPGKAENVLDDAAVAKISRIRGVETVFPDVRIPALIRFNDREELRLILVMPAKVAASKMVKYSAGNAYGSDEDNSLVVSSSLLRDFGVRDPRSTLGKKMTVSSIAFDFSLLNPMNWMAAVGGEKLPLSKENYELAIAGVTDSPAFGGMGPIQSDVFIPPGASRRMKRLPFTSVWDLFQAKEGRLGYSAFNVRLSSIRSLEPVKKEIAAMGYGTFALVDQFREIQRGFLVMDMVLAAVGMIAIVVASLGIINTMVMSILERYSEIGIMKAVGARDRDVRRIFLFESGAIGLLGGVFGLGLGAAVSGLINRIVNYFLARQGVPFINYFDFPWWLCAGAVLFSVAVSLAAGIYPAMRAVRVDPVRALRHD